MVIHEQARPWYLLLAACLCSCHFDGECDDKACVAWGHAETKPMKARARSRRKAKA